ncbi:membrane protein insertion efficiency factor YidD [Micromonospora pallida]|uniref:membrane protein insertion efficiency factor YidD n=1 Tax=Micromonospora pallida TaxID=145854 RepID=UPI001FE151FE|nr:membrane protein insertion efficiency factor YidD [Micromonospora pallida]
MKIANTDHSGGQRPCRCRNAAHCHAAGHCHSQVGRRRQGPGCKGRKGALDSCGDDPCSSSPGCCDFGLYSTLLTLGAAVAGTVGGQASARGDRSAGSRPGTLDRAGLAAIRGYRRWLSHRWPGQCRYTPTCSAYGLAAVDRYGLAVGGRLAAARLRRCRPEVPLGTVDPLS